MTPSSDELRENLAGQLEELQREIGEQIHPDDVEILLGHAFWLAEQSGGEPDLFEAHNQLVEDSVGAEMGDDDGGFLREFEDGVEQLEAKLGRSLFDKEREELYEKTSEFEVDPVATFERLHGGKDPYGGMDESARRARGIAIADQVFERAEAGEAADNGGDAGAGASEGE